MHPKTQKIINKALAGVLGLFLCLTIAPTPAHAITYGTKHFFGFSGITEQTAWTYDGGGMGLDTSDNTTGRPVRNAWGTYQISTPLNIDYFGVRFTQYDITTNENVGHNGCPYASMSVILLRINDISNINAILGTTFTSTPNIYAHKFGGGQDMPDGTCRLASESGSVQLPAGNYKVIWETPNSGGWYDIDHNYYYKLNGDYSILTQQGIIPNTNDGYFYGPTSSETFIFVELNVNDNMVDNLNFYLQEGDSDVISDTGLPTCDNILMDFSNCMSAFGNWAFVPPESTFSQFSGLKDDLSQKPPFGYISGIYSAVNTLDDNATPAFTLQSVGPINTLIFDPIRTGLAWLLYFVFAFMLFKRFRDIQI
jgi:hypothetical protein